MLILSQAWPDPCVYGGSGPQRILNLFRAYMALGGVRLAIRVASQSIGCGKDITASTGNAEICYNQWTEQQKRPHRQQSYIIPSFALLLKYNLITWKHHPYFYYTYNYTPSMYGYFRHC